MKNYWLDKKPKRMAADLEYRICMAELNLWLDKLRKTGDKETWHKMFECANRCAGLHPYITQEGQ